MANEWLKSHRTTIGENFINVKTREKYRIAEQYIEMFWRIYCGSINGKSNLYIAEVPPVGSCVVHTLLHLHYSHEVETGIYASFVKALVFAFQSVITRHIEIKDSTKYRCAVLEGSGGDSNGGKDFYLRLQFPLLKVDLVYQKTIIADWVKEYKLINPGLHLEAVPTIELIEGFPGDPVPLYGSCLMPQNVAMSLYGIYPLLLESDINEGNCNSLDFSEVFHASDSDLIGRKVLKRGMFQSDSSQPSSYVSSKVSRIESRIESRPASKISGSIVKNAMPSVRKVKRTSKREENYVMDDDISNFSFSRRDSIDSVLTLDTFSTRKSISNDWLPIYLSIQYPIESSHPKKQKTDNFRIENSVFTQEEEQNIMLRRIETISFKLPWSVRSHESIYSKKIGRIIWFHSNGSEEGFNLWMKIIFTEELQNPEDETLFNNMTSLTSQTKSTLKYEFENMDSNDQYLRHWINFRTNDYEYYTYSSLCYLLQLVDPTEFVRHVSSESYSTLAMAVDKSLEGDMAELFEMHYPGKFLYGKSWYIYSDNQWRKDEAMINIKSYLKDNFSQRLQRQKDHLMESIHIVPDEKERLKIQTTVNKVNDLCEKLKTDSFKTKVEKELRLKYGLKKLKFDEIRDENPNILAFSNCVIEFDEDEVCQRYGLPEDYNTLNTNIRYLGKIDPKIKAQIEEYFMKVYPDEEMRRWAFDYWTSCLRGGSIDKNWIVHLGPPDSSKSQMMKLMQLSFGKYALTGENREIYDNVKQSSGGGNPQTVREQGKRIKAYNELDGKTPLNPGVLKAQSGGDMDSTRDNNDRADDIIERQRLAKFSAVLNKLNPIAGGASDTALWEVRLRIILYVSKFSQSAPSDVEEQWRQRCFPAEINFEKRFQYWKETLMSMLIDNWSSYYGRPLPRLPMLSCMKSHMDRWKGRSDFTLNYINERLNRELTIDRQPNRTKTISTTKLYADYKIWFNINAGRSNPPSKAVFLEDMFSKNIIFEGSDFIGISFKKRERDETKVREDMEYIDEDKVKTSSMVSDDDYDD